ncbi:S41 family peptidase [Clostridium tarantellae]|uniref:Tail specific protease domain-containing protein n=1 Tax=Clostridium tarantellae TaxID=39493 RepID=A0A6I1MQJ3_9CLOT|nr:S41 family peptidase [Clostridium tarantellae]MPQ44758.1 hypothetical protein [Clostridium tarantellae]
MNKKELIELVCWVVFAILVVFGLVFLYLYNNSPMTIYKPKPYTPKGRVVLQKELTFEEIEEDRDKIIEIVENTHPIFLNEEVENYKKAKENFLKETTDSMNVQEFQIYISKYLSSIEDGHTIVYWNEENFLDINWRYLNGGLFLTNSDYSVSNYKVIRINEIPVENIINLIEELFPSENYVAKDVNNSKYSRYEQILTLAGIDCSNELIVTVSNGDKEEKFSANLIKWEKNKYVDLGIWSKQLSEDILFIRLGSCTLGKELDKVIEDTKKAVDNSIDNVIIDVRGNPGGNSEASTKLLESLNMVPGNFGATIRFSSLASERYGFLRKSGSISYEPTNKVVKNEDINLYVLCDENTFSSAQWLVTCVKDGNLGTIVGQGSRNMPSSFGDVLVFQLKNSNLEGQVSFKQFLRPNKDKNNERVLEPDVKIDYCEDALTKSLKIIDEKKNH